MFWIDCRCSPSTHRTLGRAFNILCLGTACQASGQVLDGLIRGWQQLVAADVPMSDRADFPGRHGLSRGMDFTAHAGRLPRA